MIDSVQNQYRMEQQEALKVYLIAVNAFVLAAGQFVGPILGSVMTSHMGFHYSTAALSGCILATAIAHHATVDIRKSNLQITTNKDFIS